jgi:hypothetical protein
MAEKLTSLFWLALLAALAVAFVADPGVLRSCAVLWVGAIGLLFALGNWLCLVALIRTRRHVSFVPALGGVLVCLALARAPVGGIGWLLLLALLLDPSIPLTLWVGARGLWRVARTSI